MVANTEKDIRKLTHFNEEGGVNMVNVSEKKDTKRTAKAVGWVLMKPETMALIMDKGISKGDVIAVAQIAGIMAAKRTADIIPMCHNIVLAGVDMHFDFDVNRCAIRIESSVTATGKTGAEMEALHAVSAAALTIYDMCKAVDKGMIIEQVMLLEKTGGKTGEFRREEHE